MNTYRQLQIPLGTILLWLSTSVSSFAATNTITPVKFQSDTVKLSVENIPSRQLNLTPDTHLIAGRIRDSLSRSPIVAKLFARFDDIWKEENRHLQPDLSLTARNRVIFNYCKIQKEIPVTVDVCYNRLSMWAYDLSQDENIYGDNRSLLENLIEEIENRSN